MSSTEVDRRKSSRERRAIGRVPFVAAVKSQSGLMPDEHVELALSVDLSPQGMRLRRIVAEHPAPRTPTVRLEFELPDGAGPIIVHAQLLFDRQDGGYIATGVRFVDLGTEEAMRIATYVASNEVEVATAVA